MKRFIVTGGYGFIGSNLINMLLKKKFKVLNIDKLSYSAQRYNLKNIKSTTKYHASVVLYPEVLFGKTDPAHRGLKRSISQAPWLCSVARLPDPLGSFLMQRQKITSVLRQQVELLS